MPTVERSALVLHSAQKMYDLVDDVQAYPQFLPWCAGVQVHWREADQVQASVMISKAGLSQQFTTCNQLVTAERIDMRLVDGPFQQLEGSWRFLPLGDDGCKVSLRLQFEFESRVIAATFGAVFNEIGATMVDAFRQRAEQLYG